MSSVVAHRRHINTTLTLSFCFSFSRSLSWSRSYRVTRTFFSQSLIRMGNSFSSLSMQGSMSAKTDSQHQSTILSKPIHTQDRLLRSSYRS